MALSEETQDQEIGTPESDDDLWASTTLDESAPQDEEPETVEVEEVPDESNEDSYEEDEDSESFEMEAQEEPKHDYQKRYKDLEREFHKRNEESARLREEFQQIRLERLEMERELERMRMQRENPPEPSKPSEPDPTDESTWFTDEDKQALEDFSEITGVVRKLIAHEVAKANKSLPLDQQISEINTLKESVQRYEQQQIQQRNHQYLVETVGPDYSEVDKSEEFFDYVMKSPVRRKIMRNEVPSTLEDKAEIMAEFLTTPVGMAKFRPQEEQVERPASTKKDQRRKAASGLLKNTAPRSSKKMEDMDDDELWSSL